MRPDSSHERREGGASGSSGRVTSTTMEAGERDKRDRDHTRDGEMAVSEIARGRVRM